MPVSVRIAWSYIYSVYLLIFKHFYFVVLKLPLTVVLYSIFSDRISDELIPHVDEDGSAADLACRGCLFC